MLSRSFRSLKPSSNPTSKPVIKPPKLSITPSTSCPKDPSSSSSSSSSSTSISTKSPWSVYLILSTNHPIKTYVGSTNNFSRRLKQHNGELVGGAKSSRAGRPWVCACLVQGFSNKSKACEFESRWKSLMRKLPRKRKIKEAERSEDDGSLALLQHRHAALCRVKGLIDITDLDVKWHFDVS